MNNWINLHWSAGRRAAVATTTTTTADTHTHKKPPVWSSTCEPVLLIGSIRLSRAIIIASFLAKRSDILLYYNIRAYATHSNEAAYIICNLYKIDSVFSRPLSLWIESIECLLLVDRSRCSWLADYQCKHMDTSGMWWFLWCLFCACACHIAWANALAFIYGCRTVCWMVLRYSWGMFFSYSIRLNEKVPLSNIFYSI